MNRYETVKAEDVKVGDVILHHSPGRGRVPAHVTHIRVTGVSLRSVNAKTESRAQVQVPTYFYDGIPFGTARSKGQGVTRRCE